MFSWIAIHREAVTKLLELHQQGAEPLATLRAMESAGLKIVSLTDSATGEAPVPLADIDPFTFFACFNRGITDERRRENWAFVKTRWGLLAEVPADFAGIPTLHNLASRLFPPGARRPADHFPLLWQLAGQAARSGIDAVDPALIDRCLALPEVSTSNLTIGLFWINPECYLAADRKSVALGETRGIEAPTENYESYRRWLKEMTSVFGTNHPATSHRAHLLATGQETAADGIPAEKMAGLWKRFRSRIAGFTDFANPGEAFVQNETAYKHQLLSKFERDLGREKLQQMIASGEGLAASKAVQRALSSNIASFHAWDPTLGTTDAACCETLASYLQATSRPYTGAESTEPVFETAGRLGLKPSWDAVTLLLWALRPDDYFPVKISHYRALAGELGRPLPKGSVTAAKLHAVIEFGRELREALADAGPKDWVDVQSFLWVVCPNSYGPAPEGSEPIVEDRPTRWWYLAAGVGGEHFDEFYNAGIAAIGARGASDLRAFGSKDELRTEIQRISGNDHNNKNEVHACWQFVHEMRLGDIIIAKTGQRVVLGKAVVEGDYQYDASRPSYRHVRKVRWLARGRWELPEGLLMPTKTLTDITPYPDHIQAVSRLIDAEAATSAERNYWWLNANPKIWSFDAMAVGQVQAYTSRNERNNKRQRYQWFQAAQPGDVVIGYVTRPQREVVAICEITKALHEGAGGEEIEFRKIEHLPRPIPYETLQAVPGLADSEPMRNNQGSLFRLTEAEYELIRTVIDETDVPPPVDSVPYTIDDAMLGLFLPKERFSDLCDALREKKNIVLQGAPGVGKTFLAKRLAYTLMGCRDDSRVAMIQFHQSYSYEDFIQGFRPTPKGNFELRNGVFFEFCRRARRDTDPTRPWVFIIDEINRGNLSKIFGELMMLLEGDKRGPGYAMPLAYAGDPDEKFFIPANVHLIGMMNTADRSLALVDYALRRRFRFLTLEPEFTSESFRSHLAGAGVSEVLASRIIDRMTALNHRIAEDKRNLGPAFRLGHSYFCPTGGTTPDDAWYRRVIESEIVPMLEEYWFDNPEKVAEERAALLD